MATKQQRDVGAADVSSEPAAPGAKSDPRTLSQAGAAALQRMSGVGGLADDVGSDVKQGSIRDAAVDVGGGLVGLAEKELPFFKYSVKAYEAQVSEKLYRGSRVDPNGMANLKKQGITGIVNLCVENDMDTAPAAQLGMHAKHIPILDNTVPTLEQIQTFLDFVASNDGPVYVHCEAGEGRTGTMCGAYRMAVQGWTSDAAIAEAKKYGMQMPVQLHFLASYGAALQGAAPPKPAGAPAT